MPTAIKIENVAKLYRLGQVGTGTISHDLNRWWASILGKEDPYAKVGEVNDRVAKAAEARDQKLDARRNGLFSRISPLASSISGQSPAYVWALKDINLEVEQGEILGIIGRNGAGKSTLLKLLSRVTAPTQGIIKTRGRITSLLEVGTGFHPELTGRENIYLNGAILGMKRHEITRRLAEIVEFSGCTKYLDTPVKRYSSGMIVRLGFAVAAHLECEILIIDEVLAVGDIEFQRQCLGKMKDVASHGRTILYVSHNMASMRHLCPRVTRLKEGLVVDDGRGEDVVSRYVADTASAPQGVTISADAERSGSGRVRITGVWFEDCNGNPLETVKNGGSLHIVMKSHVTPPAERVDSVVASIGLVDASGSYVWLVRSSFSGDTLDLAGDSLIKCAVEDLNLVEGSYRGVVFLSERDNEVLDYVKDAFVLTVSGGDFFGTGAQGLPRLCKTLTRAKWTNS